MRAKNNSNLKSKQTLKVFYQNVRGLRTKLGKFFIASALGTYDIICISEFWLHPAIADGEVVDNTYSIFRRDRDSTSSAATRGGGVFIAAKKSIPVKLIPIIGNKLEQVFIKVKNKQYDIIIGCIYIPPSSPLEIFPDHLSALAFIREKYPNSRLLIVGDYNLPSSLQVDDCAQLLYDDMNLVGCAQHNFIVKENNRTLDLCFGNDDIRVDKADAFVEEDKHHPALSMEIVYQPALIPKLSPFYLFKHGNYALLDLYFLRTNWLDLYRLRSLDDKVSWLYDKVHDGMKQFIPLRSPVNCNYPCWFSKELIRLIKLKNTAHYYYNKWRTRRSYSYFRFYRLECKKLTKICYENYVSKAENAMNSNPVEFWNFLKNKRRNDSAIPSSMSWENSTATHGTGICRLFSSFFQSVYNNDNDRSTIADSGDGEEGKVDAD